MGSGFRFRFGFLFAFLVLGSLALVPPIVVGQGTKPVARPNFDGIWNSATTTPLERPAQLKDKAFFTPEEAAAWERQVTGRNQEPSPAAAAKSTGTGTYNTFFREFGTRTIKTLRTSIITDPPDGRIPALTPAAAEVKRRRLAGIRILRARRRPAFRIVVSRWSRPGRQCCRTRTTATTRSSSRRIQS